MTELKLMVNTKIRLEDILYDFTRIDSITEDCKLELLNKLHEVESEIKYKKINWED